MLQKGGRLPEKALYNSLSLVYTAYVNKKGNKMIDNVKQTHAVQRVAVHKASLRGQIETTNSFKVLGYLTVKHKFFIVFCFALLEGAYIVAHLGTVVTK